MHNVSGNHLGIVVNTQDPENRGRVQVFIPHISTTLYKNWNEKTEDISFRSFTDSVFSGDVKERLLSVLPWAEAAVPCWGGGTGAPINESTGSAVPIPTDQAFSYSGPTGKANFKSGVNPEGLSSGMKDRVGAFASYFPDAVITSTTEGQHSQNSLHYSGNAIDIRMPKDPTEQQKIVEWWATTGAASEIGWEGDHIHIGINKNGKTTFGPERSGLAGSPDWFNSFSSQWKGGALASNSSTPNNTNEAVDVAQTQPTRQLTDGINNKDGINNGSTAPIYPNSVDANNIDKIKTALRLNSAQAQNAGVAYRTAFAESKKRGANDVQANIVASALVGNMAQESSFDSNTVHDGGIGYGLLGENRDILDRMKSYAASKNPPETIESGGISIQTQVEALFQEEYFVGSGQRRGGFETLKNSPNIETAAESFTKGYLLPTAADTANYEWRKVAAVNAASVFSGTDLTNLTQQDTGGGQNVMRISSLGITATGSINSGRVGGPMGFFSTPAIGSKVWVFFQAENPQNPVYFANAYEPSNTLAVS
jgi:hypothetical protein